MACFADYSALGSQDVTSYDNELLEAPEEEGEFDVLNDETFGNIDDDDFDWEKQTEQFAEVYDPEHIHHNNDSGFSTAEKSYKTQEEYMEHSISQLMVDDDDTDPAILKSKPIPKRQQNLDSLFGPSSPPSLLDAEQLVSPTSKNIWGSPMKDFHPPPQHVNNIQSLFDFANILEMTDRSNLFWSRLPGRSGKVKWPVQMLDTDNSQKVTVFCRADEAYFRVDHEQLEPFPGQIDKLKQNCIDILTGSDGTDDRAEPRAEDKLEHGADDRAECEAHHDPEEAYASSGDDDYMKEMLEEAGSGDDEEEFDGKRKRKSQKKAPKRQKFSQDLPYSSIHGPHSRSAPMVLPKAKTLEEIENSLLRKPRVLTAEELERQLRGESNIPPSPLSSQINGHPKPPPGIYGAPPQNMGSPLTRQLPPQMLPGHGPVPPGMVNGHRSPVFGTPISQANLGRSPVMAGSGVPMGTPQFRNRQSPVLMLNRTSPIPRSPTPPPLCLSPQTPPMIGLSFRFVTPYATSNQPRYIATPGQGLSQPIGIPRAMNGQPLTHSSPFSSPQQGLYGSPQGPYQSPHQQRMHHSGSLNESYTNRSNNNMKYQSSPHMKPQYQQQQQQQQKEGHRSDQHGEHRYHRYPYNQKYESRQEHASQRGKRGSQDVDPYAGLMTQKEKEWIIKIQLLQLQTDNPFLDDFYYASWCMKKKAKELEKDSKEASEKNLVIPPLARAENKIYKPAHFEGSLGRLTTSSVHNPRQIIDLLAKSVSETAASIKKAPSNVGKELRKSRQLFMDIEKGYNLLLDIDTLEKQIMALPEEDMRRPLLEERSLRVDLLFHYLLCDGNSAAFMQYMNVRKGRTLTKRALPYLDKVQSVGIVSLICKNLQQLMKNDQADERLEELFQPCAKVIESCNLATVVMFVEDIQHEETPSTTKPIAMALQNKFGSSILCTLLHRGEEIYSTTSPVDMDSNLQNEWTEFVHDFAGIMATLPLESILPPIHTYADITTHLERLLNKRLMAVVEDNLKIFTEPLMQNES